MCKRTSEIPGQHPLFDVPDPPPPGGVDVDDTAHCPPGRPCWVCGRIIGELSVITAGCQLGVFCMTVCATCQQAASVPDMSPAMLLDLVGEHCTHLGIDLDQMATITTGRPTNPVPPDGEAEVGGGR